MSTNSSEHVVIEMIDIDDHNKGHDVAFINSAAKSREERDAEFDEDAPSCNC